MSKPNIGPWTGVVRVVGDGITGDATGLDKGIDKIIEHGRRRRASTSTSPIAGSDKSIHLLASQFQKYFFFPEPTPLYVILGTLAGNMLKGPPLWTVMVGAPSSGKSVLLQTLARLMPDKELEGDQSNKRVHTLGAFKSTAALLSGTSKKDKSKDATGGLLREIGARGFWVMSDFTSVLSLRMDELIEIVGAMREVYDGYWERPIGGEGGKVLRWKGKVGFITAVTPAIDQFTAKIGPLGERWVMYRYPVTDGYGETITSLRNTDPRAMREDLSLLVESFFEEIELSWDSEEEKRLLTPQEEERLFALSGLVCASRSPITRDKYSGEVTDLATRESTPRIANELAQMYHGLERIGLEEDERWKVVCKIAGDSAPQLKWKIIRILHQAKLEGKVSGGVVGKASIKRVVDGTQCGNKIVRHTLIDLKLHGVIEMRVDMLADGETFEQKSKVWLTDWAVEQVEIGWKGMEI